MNDRIGEILERQWARRKLLVAGVAAGAAAAVGVGGSMILNGRQSATRVPAGAAEPAPGASIGTASDTPAARQPIGDPWKRASHLLRRAGFGGTKSEIERFAGLSPSEAAERLLNYDTVDNSALDERLSRSRLTRQDLLQAARPSIMHGRFERWWLTRMAYTSRPLEERMTLIWHGLLTTQFSTLGIRAPLVLRQNDLYRSLALGRFDDLLLAASKDAAMMFYLDTAVSSALQPNENFARELLELFSMGVGNFSEEDVREAARAFTGWRVTPPPPVNVAPDASPAQRLVALLQAVAQWEPEWVLEASLHDIGVKRFLGREGPFGGEDIVAIVMEEDATARHITERLFRELAYPDPEEETIDRLVDVWNGSGHSVREVVRAILTTDEFLSVRAYRAKVRSPVELVVATVRGLELETDFGGGPGTERDGTALGMGDMLEEMGQRLFEPPSVAGWPGGPAWLSSSTLFGRFRFAGTMFFPRGEPAAVPVLEAAGEASAMVDEALLRLVDGDFPEESRNEIVSHVAGIRDARERAATVAYLVACSPQFQLA